MARAGDCLSRVLVLTLLAGGCGDASMPPGATPPDASPPDLLSPFTSGSRFEARFLAGPGLEPLLLAVHDRQEGRDCLLFQESGGPVRCRSLDPEIPGTPAPAGTPVEGEPAEVALTSRLSGRIWVTRDGGRFPLFRNGSFEFGDSRWDAACAPVQSSGGLVDCLPPFAAHSYLFADAACSDPLVQQAQDEPPLLAMLRATPRALGELWTGPVHAGASSICNRLAEYDAPLRRPGPPLAADAVVRLHRVPRGQGRLALLAFESQGRMLAPARDARKRLATAYFDAELNLECTPVRSEAGVRCLAGVDLVDASELRFRDAACTEPVLPVGPTVALLAPPDDHPLARVLAVHEAGEFFGGGQTAVYRKQDGGCVLRPEKNTFRPLGATLPWDRWAPLEEWLGPHRL